MVCQPTTKCRSCGVEVMWVETETGKRMPLDAKPRKDGNIVLRGGKAVYVKKSMAVPSGELRYVSHFATCPDAGKWRK